MIIDKALSKIFGTKHERDIKAMQPRVAAINALEPGVKALSDAQIRERVAGIRARVQEGLEKLPEELEERRALSREVLDKELVEVFALVREAAWRSIGQRHYDVQLMGGMVLHEGKIAEMRTGEGKTLVATLAISLNALSGRGAHLVTVNDYLARRDAEWMGQIYQFLGFTVGCIQHDMPDEERRDAYARDITFGTNNEFGFDYLRDNMKFELPHMVQRGHVFAVVDEVDSILIDEARTPLIISGPSEGETDIYYKVDRIIPKLVKGEEIKDKYGNKTTTGDYLLDERAHTSSLTEEGVTKCERLLGVENLYDPTNIDILHACQQALRAHTLYKRDVSYVVRDGQVIIVDEFTGRLMPGRRWSDGLHQAVEAKEGVKIEKENQTLATITLQNYFRMYDKLAGMTGTADTEAAEFDKIYKLDVVVIPTNRDMIRIDEHDLVYRTEREKFEAVVEEIAEKSEKGQPVLVGTISIEKSELLSTMLKKKKVPHVVLNAKYHEQEATIVAQAGQVSAVTIATNMAGRGTDILLGGNPEYLAKQKAKDKTPEEIERIAAEFQKDTAEAHEQVVELGGLHIIGTERHESRRIDNQLRGRSGRQGDPGSSRFYLSLEDDLMRIFGSDRLSGLMKRLGMEEGVPIEHRWVTKSIERAQTQVEGRNFDTRKHLLEYDDVMNKQREEIYRLRKEILTGTLSRDYVVALAEDVSEDYVDRHCPAGKDPSEWGWDAFESLVLETYGFKPSGQGLGTGDTNTELKEKLRAAVRETYETKEKSVGAQTLRDFEKFFMLQTVDTLWKDHLLAPRPPQGRHRPARLRAARPARRVQEGVVPALRGDEGRHRGADPPVPLPFRGRRGARRACGPPERGGALPALAAAGGSAASRRAASDLEKRAKQKEQNLQMQGSFDPTAGGDFDVSTVKASGPEGRPQRSLPVRLREEVQEMPRGDRRGRRRRLTGTTKGAIPSCGMNPHGE